MNKFILALFFITVFADTRAQQQVKFNDLVEVTDSGAIKIYLSAVFKASYEYCADYYMIADFDREYFQIKDTFKIYYRTDELFLEGRYKNGERHGKYTWYHKNGQIKTIGEYTSGKRSGVWEYYYTDGSLYKRVEFKDDREYLLDLYGKWGKEMVKNGKGYFDDEVIMSVSGKYPFNLKGEVVNGLPEGKWQIYVSKIKIGTEYFKDNSFEKGVSHSIALGDEKYYDAYLSTFTGIVYIEHLQLFSPSFCKNKMSLGLTQGFFNNLKEQYNSSALKNAVSNNWFLVEIESGKADSIVNVEVFSFAGQDLSNQLKNLVLEMKNVNKLFTNSGTGRELFPVVIYNNDIYFFPNEKIGLLKHYF